MVERQGRRAVPRIDLYTRSRGTVYDRTLLRNRREGSAAQSRLGESLAASAVRRDNAQQAAAELKAGAELREALTLAREGDDSELLPYQPTRTIGGGRPRTVAAGYDERTRILRVRFRDGTPWEYYNVPAQVWTAFSRANSPGRFINNTLNSYDHGPGDF